MADPIHITVTLYASLRDAASVEEVSLDLPSGSTVGAVWPVLADRFPAIAPMRATVAWAVNHCYASLDQSLSDGDSVAALPPISGGAEFRRRP